MSRKQQQNKGSWSELILFAMVILCIYFILALFDSAFTGDSGREWGKYLRTAWGGAVIVPLLFWLYLNIAGLMKFRVPRIPRQILGTIQLYISFAFMLGLLKEIGWESDWTLFLPGNFGHGLARFFVLNVGTFITLLLVICSFVFSAYIFGSKVLKFSLPSFSQLKLNFKFRNNSEKTRRERRNQSRKSNRYYDVHSKQKQGEIALPGNFPAPVLKDSSNDNNNEESKTILSDVPKIQPPKLKPAPEDESNAIAIIDNILASIDAGILDTTEEKREKDSPRTRTKRRALAEVQDNDINSGYDEPVIPAPLELFGDKPAVNENSSKNGSKNLEKQGKIIISTLKNFGINASVAHIISGASVIQYQLELAPGTKVNKISGLSEDLAMALAVISVRVEAPILGTHYAGVEVPNSARRIITLRDILESEEFTNSRARLPLPLGVQIDGKNLIHGLEDIQNILIAGNKGSGKNMFLNSCILTMCAGRRPEELKLILIDTRHVNFSVYDGLPHLLSSPVYDTEKALDALVWAYKEMENRMLEFSHARVRNFAAYNKNRPDNEKLPEIVIIIDELADLMYSSENKIENLLVRLVQKSGAAGIYTIIASQRPSPDVVTSLIKSNIPARSAFMLASQNDSKNIINIPDAAMLTGKGDMLFRNMGSPQPVRLQAPYTSEENINDFVEYMISNLEAAESVKFQEE